MSHVRPTASLRAVGPSPVHRSLSPSPFAPVAEKRRERLDVVLVGPQRDVVDAGPLERGLGARGPVRRPGRRRPRGRLALDVSTSAAWPVSASTTRSRPTAGSDSSRGSTRRTATRSCFCETTRNVLASVSCVAVGTKKSLTRTTMARRRWTRRTWSSATPRSVPGETGSWAYRSRSIRSTWRFPFLGRTNRSTRSVNRTSPTLSLLRSAENPSTAQTSAARSRLARAEPKSSEPDTSTTSSSVCSRSSSNSLT